MINKYQKYIFGKYGVIGDTRFIISRCCPIEDEDTTGESVSYGTLNRQNDSFTILQDENITKTKYMLSFPGDIDGYHLFDGIFISKNNEWIKVETVNNEYRIIADFSDRINAIKFCFVNGIADDYILNIEYREADKEKYFAKIAKEKKEALEKAASIKVATGADLVNVYFQPCCDEYDHTEILLYISREGDFKGRTSNDEKTTIESVPWLLIKKSKIPVEDFYASISGLAYGKYAFILKQYDKNDNVIIQTDYITFIIEQPQVDCGHWNII